MFYKYLQIGVGSRTEKCADIVASFLTSNDDEAQVEEFFNSLNLLKKMNLALRFKAKQENALFKGLERGLEKPRSNWSHLIEIVGTPKTFTERVYIKAFHLAQKETLTYGELAKRINSKAPSPRGVGQALKRNPWPYFVPCHKVLSASGLGGFMGSTSKQSQSLKSRMLSECSILKSDF